MGYLSHKGKESVYLVPAMSLGLSTVAGDQKAQQIPFKDRNKKKPGNRLEGIMIFFPPGVEGCFQFKRSSKLLGSGFQKPRDTDAALP